MDIGSLSMDLNQMDVQQQVNISLMKMAMDSMEMQSGGLTEIIEQSVDPNLGQNIDISL